MRNPDPFTALNRFGLGARPGDAAAIEALPRAWVADQFYQKNCDTIPNIPDSATRLKRLEAYRQARLAAGKQEAAKAAMPSPGTTPVKKPSPLDTPPNAMFDYDLWRRTELVLASDTPVIERLAHFWSNHFCISAMRDDITVLAVPYENEAIRPHIFGHFRDMLQATATHPAMLYYLDAASSIGPDSTTGLRQKKSLNENYAREIMELHSLGVNGGYTQNDVEELARVLTGLGIAHEEGEAAWFFDRHEPGTRHFLGRNLADGPTQFSAALDILATHPATIKHVCTKLAAHYCADAPVSLVKKLAQAWRRSSGNLPDIYKVLAAAPEIWQAKHGKYRNPQDFAYAAGRALQLHGHGKDVLAGMRALAQAPFRAPAPTGWSDQDNIWLTPAGVNGRIGLAQHFAQIAPKDIDAPSLLPQIVDVTDKTPIYDAVIAEPNPQKALALCIAAVEFQRR
jgi:uncharacterized protein (DUF1800 family)